MVNDIFEGVSIALHSAYGDEAEIYFSTDVQQGLKAPCFLITSISIDRKQITGRRYRQNLPLDISYFPLKQKDNAIMRSIGEVLFDVLEVITLSDGDMLRGRDMSYKITGGVLHFLVTYSAHLRRVEDLPEMEKLKTDIRPTK